MRKFQPLLIPDSQPEEPLTVSALTAQIKRLIEDEPGMADVRVRGEISNLSRPASGHLYFTLKDGGAQIRCAMWRSAVGRMRNYRPQNGEAVIARGRVGVYERDGAYQLYVEALAALGMGDLHAEFERLKEQLQAEGLFDPDRKRALPQFPRVIGIVTSPGAAALQDILNVLRRRYPLAEVVLSPTLVQGADAPPQIVRALQRLQTAHAVDVILIARGGGSLEELWAFNDERVVRAVAASRIPTVSGVGHEVDFTLTDFAADVRAPTPSAAAEIIAPDVNDLRQSIDAAAERLSGLMLQRLAEARSGLDALTRALRALSPAGRVQRASEQVRGLRARLRSAMLSQLALRRAALGALRGRLDAVSPLATLARGYAIVRLSDGGLVRSAGQVQPGAGLRVRVADGEFGATAGDAGR